MFVEGTKRIGCIITWTNRNNTAVNGAIYYPQYIIVEDCLAACAHLVPGCVAAQVVYRVKPIRCFLLTEINSLYSAAMDSSGVILYALSTDCGLVTAGWPTNHSK